MSDKQKVEALLYLMGKKQFHILEVETLAKVLGSAMVHTFEIVGPKGRLKFRWVDPHYGIFERIDENDASQYLKGFSTNQFQFVIDIHCENLEGSS
jgi:hypothetical protein